MDSNRELGGEPLLPAHSFSRPRCRVARSDDTLDPDFDPLRQYPRFQKLVACAK